MRKLLFAAVVSLAGVALTTGQASAWFGCKRCCTGSATLCIRQYNAFSPSCFGSIACDGCFPVGFSQGAPWGGGGPIWGGHGGSCGPDGSCAGPPVYGAPIYAGTLPPGATAGAPIYAGTLPPGAIAGAPIAPGATAGTPIAPGTPAPNFQAPPPAQTVPVIQPPAPMPVGPNGTSQGWPVPVQAAGYRNPYYPAYGYGPGYAPGYGPQMPAPMPWMPPSNYPGYGPGVGGR
jgi:hypothetical protein